MFKVPEEFRVKDGRFRTRPTDGNNGFFVIPSDPEKGVRQMHVIVSDCGGWEHVSAKVAVGPYSYTPTAEEMQHVKLLFWDDEDSAMQFYPAASERVNYHENVLHLWRPIILADDEEFQQTLREHMPDDMNWPIPEPPAELFGPKGISFIERKGL